MLNPDIYESWDASHAGTRYPFADDASLLATDGATALPAGVICDLVVGVRGLADPVYVLAVNVGAATVEVVFGQAGAAVATAILLADAAGWVPLTSSIGVVYAGKVKLTPNSVGALFGLGIGPHAFDATATAVVPYAAFLSPAAGVSGIKLPDGTVLTGDVTICLGSGLDAEVRADGAVIIHATGLPFQGRDTNGALRRAIRKVEVDASSGDGTSASAVFYPVRGAIAATTDAPQATLSPAIVINGQGTTVTVEVSS